MSWTSSDWFSIGIGFGSKSDGPVHGTPVKCLHSSTGLFRGLNEVSMTRDSAHLTADCNTSKDIVIDATDDTKSLVLAFHCKKASVFGVQFHPESVEVNQSHILSNFLKH